MCNKVNFMPTLSKQFTELSSNNARASKRRIACNSYFKFPRQSDAPPDL